MELELIKFFPGNFSHIFEIIFGLKLGIVVFWVAQPIGLPISGLYHLVNVFPLEVSHL